MLNSRLWILAAALTVSTTIAAQASVTDSLARFLGLGDRAPVEEVSTPTPYAPVTVTAPGSITETVNLSELAASSLPLIGEWPEPSIEKPLHRLFCVQYARAVSGLNIFEIGRAHV